METIKFEIINDIKMIYDIDLKPADLMHDKFANSWFAKSEEIGERQIEFVADVGWVFAEE